MFALKIIPCSQLSNQLPERFPSESKLGLKTKRVKPAVKQAIYPSTNTDTVDTSRPTCGFFFFFAVLLILSYYYYDITVAPLVFAGGISTNQTHTGAVSNVSSPRQKHGPKERKRERASKKKIVISLIYHI